jgi:hypothetical protein
VKLNQQERLALYGQILSSLLPLRIKTTPPGKDGKSKAARWEFASACWARRVLDSAEYVLERDGQAEEPRSSGAGPSSNGADDVPF